MRSQIEIWCNGSTTDFGSVCLGSNPGISTQKAGDIFIGFFVFANARRHFGNVDKTHPESWPPKPALHEPSAPPTIPPQNCKPNAPRGRQYVMICAHSRAKISLNFNGTANKTPTLSVPIENTGIQVQLRRVPGCRFKDYNYENGE